MSHSAFILEVFTLSNSIKLDQDGDPERNEDIEILFVQLQQLYETTTRSSDCEKKNKKKQKKKRPEAFKKKLSKSAALNLCETKLESMYLVACSQIRNLKQREW